MGKPRSASQGEVMLGWKRNAGSSPGTKRASCFSSGSLQQGTVEGQGVERRGRCSRRGARQAQACPVSWRMPSWQPSGPAQATHTQEEGWRTRAGAIVAQAQLTPQAPKHGQTTQGLTLQSRARANTGPQPSPRPLALLTDSLVAKQQLANSAGGEEALHV